MVGKMCLAVFVVCGFISQDLSAADEPKLIQREFNNCFLQEVDGRIWLREPHVSLGMVGVGATPPFCLNQDLARKFTPLVTKVISKKESNWRRYHIFGMPKLSDSKDSLILLRLKTKMRPHEDDASKSPYQLERPFRPSYYEITLAHLISIECVRGGWIQAWEKLDQALRDFVSVSLTSPEVQKRDHLVQILEEGCKALNAMSKVEVTDDFRALVREIEPDARFVHTFQLGVMNQWQERLEKYAARLGILPKRPLPKRLGLLQSLELIAASNSPSEFISEVKQSWSEHFLGQPLIHSKSLKRTVHLWEIEKLTETEFERIRTEAREFLAEIEKDERQVAEQPSTMDIKQWGVVVVPANRDLLAKKLILRGLVVEKVLPDQAGIGLRVGDLILDYDRVYDLVMGDFNRARSIQTLVRKVGKGHGLRVLRGDNIVILQP